MLGSDVGYRVPLTSDLRGPDETKSQHHAVTRSRPPTTDFLAKDLRQLASRDRAGNMQWIPAAFLRTQTVAAAPPRVGVAEALIAGA